jgi:lipopolysaccharide biosynthesis regulator YciM
MLELIKHEKSVQNLSILASIYFYQKDYAMSLKYYDTVYKKANDEASLLMIVELLDNHLNKTNEAISYLETHSRMQGCTKAVCYKLIQIYGKNKNIKGLISVYRRLYEKFGQKEDASKVVELLIYDNNQKEAIEFLKKSKHDPDTLIQLYASKKEFAKAYDTAKEIYEEAGDLHYLGLMAVYEYEGAKKKDSKALLDSVSKKFERVVQKSKDPLFLNYYGYLLIDHSIDIKKGISLVQKALIYEPQSPYYIDSLAWGYYKLNECKKALETIEPIIDKTNEPEVLEHYELILDCIRKKRDTR